MTETQQFIDDAINVGWKGVKIADEFHDNQTIEFALLDPLAWQAVGKTRGWKGNTSARIWLYKWHEFIHALADGKSIEDALLAIK